MLLAELPDEVMPPEQRVLIHQTDAKHAAGLGGEQIDLNVDGQTLNFEAGDRIMSARQPEGEFPDIDGLVPEKEGTTTLTFDIKYLVKALRALQKFGHSGKVSITFKDDKSCTTLAVEKAGALVMPIDTGAIECTTLEALRPQAELV